MGYSEAELQLLRRRWSGALTDPASGQAGEVAGCRSFQELLGLRMGQIGLLVAGSLPAGGSLPEAGQLRSFWGERCDAIFLELARELAQHGLAEVTPVQPQRYGVREVIDLRGAALAGVTLCGGFLESVDFTGADLQGARLEGARCIEARFDHALCTRASFARAECNFASFRGALCDHASFLGSDCSLAVFQRARLRHATFAGAVCFAATFDGAYLADALLAGMSINHLTDFGRPGELAEAAASTPARARQGGEEDWYITELFPAWLRAAQVVCRIRVLFKSHGYFLKADEYQYHEMVCRRHLLQQSRGGEFFEWLFKDLIFGYGLKWKRPLISVLTIIVLWGAGFAWHFRISGLHGVAGSIGYGLYYSVISFTTLGFGNAPDLNGPWPRLLLCSEALLGTILTPLFLLAYARKILQD